MSRTLDVQLALGVYMASEEEFERLLLEAIDEGFSAIGESSKQAVYYHLENEFKMPRQEIPKKIDEFEHAIEGIFGLGADYVEILIMKFLCEKVKRRVRLQSPRDFKFTVYVKAAKRSFLQQKEDVEKRITEELVSSSRQG